MLKCHRTIEAFELAMRQSTAPLWIIKWNIQLPMIVQSDNIKLILLNLSPSSTNTWCEAFEIFNSITSIRKLVNIRCKKLAWCLIKSITSLFIVRNSKVHTFIVDFGTCNLKCWKNNCSFSEIIYEPFVWTTMNWMGITFAISTD